MPCSRAQLVCAAFFMFMVLSGCTDRLGDFTMISTKNVDLSDAEVNLSKGRRATEDDCKPVVIIFPIGRPDLKEAVDSALEEGQGNLMVDLVVYSRWWYVPPIFGLRCMVAEGTVVDIKPTPQAALQ